MRTGKLLHRHGKHFADIALSGLCRRRQPLIGGDAQYGGDQRVTGNAADAFSKKHQQRHPNQHRINHVVAQQTGQHPADHQDDQARLCQRPHTLKLQRQGKKQRQKTGKQHILGAGARKNHVIGPEGEYRRANPRRTA